MSWGAIYSQSWWGRAIANNFGDVYSDEVNIKPLLKAIQDRSTYYENEAGTTALLQQLEDCELVETLGEELIVNGDFSDGLNGWTSLSGAILSVSNSSIKIEVNSDGYAAATQQVSFKENTSYEVSYNIVSGSSNEFRIDFGLGSDYRISHQPMEFGEFKSTIKTPSTISNPVLFRLENNDDDGLNDTVVVSNISIKEIIQTA